ncbi:MAG: glycosyltransferase family 4 protein [Trueperaceae bacterium]|nr:glycosyltransferase family 4 protein [Trueperaceae bacterium]
MQNLWIINQYALPKGTAGITRHGDFAHELVKMGYKVTVFASGFDYLTRQHDRSEGKNAHVTEHDGVKFVWLKTPSYQGNDSKRVKNMVSFFKTVLLEASFGKYGQPDVILGSSPHLLSGLAGSLLATRYRTPFILELRDVWPDDLVALKALKEGSLTHRLLQGIANHLYWRADKILTVPPKLHRYLANSGVKAQKIMPLPNGVFLDEARDKAELPESLKHLFEVEKDRFKVVYMGAHGVANDLGNVLLTARHLKMTQPEVYEKLAFFLVGGGQQKEMLMQMAEELKLEHVHFHDPVEKAVVPLVTEQADALLVHLHEADTFNKFGRSPNKLYDYLAAAKPVLYSTTDDSTILERTGSGMTFKPNDPRAFAEVLETLLSMSETKRQAMGQAGRKAVEREHDLVKLAEQLAGVLDELCQPAPSALANPLQQS